MTAGQLAAIAGVILSLLFSYVPRLSDWYAGLDGTHKRLVMLTLLVIAAGGVLGLSCGNVVVAVTCDKAGILGLVQALIAAIIANQSTFLISPQKSRKK